MNYRFGWRDRLHGKADFSRTIQEGRRYQGGGLTLWIYRHPEPGSVPPQRLGLAISRRYGNAVARNHLKRLLREVFRLNRNLLVPGVDMVFGARPFARKPDFHTVKPIVLELWKKARILAG